MKKLVEENKIREEKDKEAKEAEQTRLEKQRRYRKIFIVIAIVVCIILAVPISHAIQISQRTTYTSESEMMEALQGVWTHYDSQYAARYKLYIGIGCYLNIALAVIAVIYFFACIYRQLGLSDSITDTDA